MARWNALTQLCSDQSFEQVIGEYGYEKKKLQRYYVMKQRSRQQFEAQLNV